MIIIYEQYSPCFECAKVCKLYTYRRRGEGRSISHPWFGFTPLSTLLTLCFSRWICTCWSKIDNWSQSFVKTQKIINTRKHMIDEWFSIRGINVAKVWNKIQLKMTVLSAVYLITTSSSKANVWRIILKEKKSYPFEYISSHCLRVFVFLPYKQILNSIEDFFRVRTYSSSFCEPVLVALYKGSTSFLYGWLEKYFLYILFIVNTYNQRKEFNLIFSGNRKSTQEKPYKINTYR